MLVELKNLKEKAIKMLIPLEKEIEEAANETENKYLVDFCIKQEKQLNETSEIVKVQMEKLKEYMTNILNRKANMDKENFKNKLAVVVLLLERQMKTKSSLEEATKMLTNLGRANPLIASVSEALTNNSQIMSGLEELKELHEEFHRSIRRARLAAYIGQNKGLGNYCIMSFVCGLFARYRFPYWLKSYAEDRNSVLVTNLQHLDYLEQAISDRNYEEAWTQIESLTVSLSQ